MSDKPAFIHHVNFPTTNPERTIEWYSKVFGMKYITLHPGDVLWMGADATVPMEPGNVVDIEISGIGVLSNPVLAEDGNDRHGTA